ncbi:MAG TPA: phosphomannomutase/phosphoglucomutase [Gaiellaceae bacterium]|nr:phosphomannomutase/phosphoglucomutase [Gaiellaceae bacterium]
MALDPKVFKAYDVRGIYPSELDEEGARAIGRAYVEQFEPKAIAVGRDMRLSSPCMHAAFVQGASEAGADVLDVGMIGTEMLYQAVGELGLDGGATVTASHNPKDYTGMKIVRRGALPVGADSGLLEIRDRALSIAAGARGQTPDVAGKVERRDTYGDFVRKVMSFVDTEAVGRLRVVIDAANGMAGPMLAPILERLPVDAVRCSFEPDGSFPSHEPNPLLPENREFIVAKVTEERADLGIAFDGDADRCFFVDDTGEFVPGDFVTALLAEAMLEKEPGGTVIYDVRASWAVRDTVEKLGGKPVMSRVGHAYIKLLMREVDAVFAGEVSGHYYFRDFYQADSGTIPALLLLELVSKRGQKLSEILRPLRGRYFITGEINTPVADVALTVQELKEHFAGQGEISHLDGISVTADDWHLNVRPSNTEPLLRLNLEALDRNLMERKRDEALAVIRG